VATGSTDLEFDRGIAVLPREPTAYDARLDPGWRIGAGINGGLLLAVLGNALRHTFPAPHGDPFSISGYYLSASRPGPATVRTRLLRAGRGTTTGQASLSQRDADGEVERIRALATYGDLSALPADVRTTAAPPDLPPPEKCVSSADAPPPFMEQAELLRRLDLRLDPACAGWAVGHPSGRGEIRGWLRMADGREPDPLLLLLAVDALPPVTFDLGLFGWTPTLELTVHVRAAPEPGWLLVRHATRNLAGGLLEEDAEVWDAAGRLVAQSRQLALVPRPRQ
jgi:Acyl-CoA thioesterase C-terminal domain/Acyl-CoA thioesterase N-terminal domain